MTMTKRDDPEATRRRIRNQTGEARQGVCSYCSAPATRRAYAPRTNAILVVRACDGCAENRVWWAQLRYLPCRWDRWDEDSRAWEEEA